MHTITTVFRHVLNQVGIDVIRYRPQVSDLAWVKPLGIKTVFDVGANIGQFAHEIRHELPDAYIYSFEPITSCYDILTSTMKKDPRFHAFNSALGAAKGKATINISGYSPSSSLLEQSSILKEQFPHTKNEKTETITVDTLDAIWKTVEHPGHILVKMDVQGFEDKVIDGGKECLRHAHALIIETSFVQLYENQPLFDDIYRRVYEFGFRYHGAMRSKRSTETHGILFEDSVFLRA